MMMMMINKAVLVLLAVASRGATALSHDAEARFRVHGLEDIEPAFASFQGKMYAGLLPFHLEDEGQERGEFMFWLFEPDHIEVDNALSIYLSGGPGCSSIGTGNFFGSGPIGVPKFPAGRVDPSDKDAPLMANPNAWTKATYMLYVEQPATTGFSYGPLPSTEEDVARDMYNFLINFFNVFTHLKERDLFLWGGSYSGMNVPALARKIVHENKKPTNAKYFPMNLEAISLGNAWLDAKIQGPAMVDFAWSHGMIDLYTRNTFHGYWDECIKGNKVKAPMHPFNVPDECGMDEIVLQAAGADLFDDQSPNAYDITTWDTYSVLDDHGTINRFYNNPAVQKALHAPNIDWHGCVVEGWMLNNDKPESVVPYVAELLDEAGIRVLFWNGDLDLLCCTSGTELVLDSMEWSGAAEWKTADRGVWMVNGRKAGYSKTVGNLTYVTVYNSGHMVYYNQPVRCYDLVKRQLKGESFLDTMLPYYPPVDSSGEHKKFHETLVFRAVAGLLIGAALYLVFHVIMSQKRSTSRGEYEEVKPPQDSEYGTNGSSAYRD